MKYNLFLEKVIEDGMKATKNSYKNYKNKLEGVIDGFNACKNLDPEELKDILETASEYVTKARMKRDKNYWYFRCYEAEIEWIINVVSSAMIMKGLSPLIPNLTTARGLSKAESILKEEELELPK